MTSSLTSANMTSIKLLLSKRYDMTIKTVDIIIRLNLEMVNPYLRNGNRCQISLHLTRTKLLRPCNTNIDDGAL